MVCRECGAYNAEHLTHCRVCAARLKEPDNMATEDTSEQEDGGRPAREFVSAPSWPTRAYAGAPENQPYQPAPQRESRIREQADALAASAATVKKQTPSEQKSFCASCGKPLVAGAPFCPYCGSKIESDGEEEAVVKPAQGHAAVSNTAASYTKHTAARKDDYDDDDDETDEYEDDEDTDLAETDGEENLDEYDDDDEYDDEFDDDDDDMPKRGKGSTILFWVLIVVLLVLIGVFGFNIINKNYGNFNTFISSVFGGKTGDTGESDNTGELTGDIANTPQRSTIQETTDADGQVYYEITIYAPEGSTAKINTAVALKTDTTTMPASGQVTLRLPQSALLPNEPLSTSVYSVTPDIQITEPSGSSYKLDIDAVSFNVPSVSLALTSPEGGAVNASINNDPITISGTVDDHTVDVYVNGEAVTVHSDEATGKGIFSYTYTPGQANANTQNPTGDAVVPDAGTDGAGATLPETTDTAVAGTTTPGSTDTAGATTPGSTDTAGTTTPAGTETTNGPTATPTAALQGAPEYVTIEAKKNNCATATQTVTVQPYVMQNMVLSVTNELKDLRSDEKDGVLTINGTVTAGATLTAACASDKVTFSAAVVAADGTFTLTATMAEVGVYDVKITAKQLGYYDAEATATLLHGPSSSSSFMKNCRRITKDYDKLKAGETTSTVNYVVEGKIVSYETETPYVIAKVKLSGGDICYVASYSAKAKVGREGGSTTHFFYGTYAGLYGDTGCPFVWGWFLKK